MKKLFILLFLATSFLVMSSCNQNETEQLEGLEIESENENEINEPAPETPLDNIDSIEPACLKTLYYDHLQPFFSLLDCAPANKSQLDQVNQGNLKKDQFLSQCFDATGGSCWCDQLIRPNPSSYPTFECTYGPDQVHQLIHPDEDTWPFAYEAVKIVEEFQDEGILTEIIYNWWRPEPYNKNVGGSATRHPFGTSIDVRFQTKAMQEMAFNRLCEMRASGRLRAIGYYASTAIHMGIGDHKANTWGKACPLGDHRAPASR